MEKAQDNVSKRAAVEKDKYYNRDINVVEWENVPEFSTPDDTDNSRIIL